MVLLDELLELEHAGWRSLCEGTGARFYSGMMTEDGLMILAHGMALDRDATAAALRDAPPWAGYELVDPGILRLGDGAAALLYTGRAWRAGEEQTFTALMASTYRRTGDGWRLALYQQTPVPQP
jgi:hypothetical protein